ncbi:MAG: hypothetical protein ACQGVC_22000 [Myxococcota bacterium]
MSDAAARRLGLAVAFGLLAFGLLRAAQLAWICDDAFVSLRYAANLVAGHGLVYNAGEYVEGYTNLLWTLALAAALRLGAPDLASAQWLGIASYLGLALALLHASWRRSAAAGRPFLPLTAGVVLVSPDFHVWASGGLETASFTALATVGVVLARDAATRPSRALPAGLVLSLLTLTRPDGLLFAGVAGLVLLWRAPRERRLASCLALGIPVAVTVAAWAAFKASYYGELLPTAFHSKSVLRPYYAQGAVYLGLFLAKNWYLPAAGAALLVWRLRGGGARGDGSALALALPALVFWLYVVHVGGDFMFARRVLPAVPLLLLALEETLDRLADRRVRALCAAACVAAAALPWPVFDDATPRIRGVADEPRFYPQRVIDVRRRQAEVVAEALRGSDARVMFEGGMCVFGYYSGLPYLAEMTGLTQYSLAKLPLGTRGWIGHEKRATDAWLSENDIHLIVGQAFPPVSRPPGGDTLDLVYFGDVAVARIHRYDPALMRHLAEQRGVSFVPIERVVERRRAEIERAPRERAREILAWLDRYWFDGAGDAAREQRARLAALVESRP